MLTRMVITPTPVTVVNLWYVHIKYYTMEHVLLVYIGMYIKVFVTGHIMWTVMTIDLEYKQLRRQLAGVMSWRVTIIGTEFEKSCKLTFVAINKN